MEGLGPPPEASKGSTTTAARATGVAMARWQGGKVSAQSGRRPARPPPGGWAPSGPDIKHAAPPQVSRHLTPLPPEDETLACRHLLHGQFGRRICHILILRCAKLALATARANMPVKAPVTSLAGSIDSTFISEAVKQYTELLAQKKIPKFEDLANMEAPEGFVTHEPKYWYKPWAPVGLTRPRTPAEEKNDPVIKMAGAIETTPFTKGGQTPKPQNPKTPCV